MHCKHLFSLSHIHTHTITVIYPRTQYLLKCLHMVSFIVQQMVFKSMPCLFDPDPLSLPSVPPCFYHFHSIFWLWPTRRISRNQERGMGQLCILNKTNCSELCFFTRNISKNLLQRARKGPPGDESHLPRFVKLSCEEFFKSNSQAVALL